MSRIEELAEIWLSPRCDQNCERTWCEDPSNGCDWCGKKPVRYMLDKRHTGREAKRRPRGPAFALDGENASR